MLTNQIIQTTIDELNSITKVDFAVYEVESGIVAATCNREIFNTLIIEQFISSGLESQSANEFHYLKVKDEGDTAYILVSVGTTEYAYTMGKVAVSQLQNLIIAYKERVDRSNFFQNLILDNLLLVDIHNRATKLHIENEKLRMVYLIEILNDRENVAAQMLKSLFVEQGGNYITSVDEKSIILIKDMNQGSTEEDYTEVADTIVDMLESEAMLRARVSYGLPVKELKNVSKCYKEAKMALEVGSIFHSEMKVLSYDTLGIGRLIYQLPVNLCKIFVKEVFGDIRPQDIDDETIGTINKFFENNLNVSETARQLYIHRNTLVYRMEKLQKSIGLDMRKFDDAVTFKIAMMVVDYVDYLEKQNI